MTLLEVLEEAGVELNAEALAKNALFLEREVVVQVEGQNEDKLHGILQMEYQGQENRIVLELEPDPLEE